MHFGVHALPEAVCGDARGIYVKRAQVVGGSSVRYCSAQIVFACLLWIGIHLASLFFFPSIDNS